MRRAAGIPAKIYTTETIIKQVAAWRVRGQKIAFTNGVYDVLHEGHIHSLCEAAKQANKLIVGVNSDASTKRLKGPSRPINNQQARMLILASLLMVDAVVMFDNDTPIELIKAIMPDVLVKGGDYTVEQIVGSKEVIENGGKVVINSIIEGVSSTKIIERIG
jgi:D-glycero-beta-D-manno-heptose 1-phosphate adenylyltransferase